MGKISNKSHSSKLYYTILQPPKEDATDSFCHVWLVLNNQFSSKCLHGASTLIKAENLSHICHFAHVLPQQSYTSLTYYCSRSSLTSVSAVCRKSVQSSLLKLGSSGNAESVLLYFICIFLLIAIFDLLLKIYIFQFLTNQYAKNLFAYTIF